MKATVGISTLMIFLVLGVHGQVPGTLSYQGILTDANGNPVSDATSHTVLFNFYNLESGGTPLFTRGPLTVSTFKGLFTTIIGSDQGSNNTPLPYSIGNEQIWIGIVADGQAELTPRVRLTTVPYAFMAQGVVAVDAASITSGTISNSRLDADLQDLADGSLSGSKIGSGIDATNLTTGSIDAALIPDMIKIPVGTIVAYAATTPPSGWLLCDGSAISRTTYSALYSIVSTTWGQGDANTTFNLPDLRGRFLRGVNGSATLPGTSTLVDPDADARINLSPDISGGATGNDVGSYQSDELRSHTHDITLPQAGLVINYGSQDNALHGALPTKTYSTLATGGIETRPQNAYVNFIIKY